MILLIAGGCGQSFHGTAVTPPRPVRDFRAPDWNGKTFQLADHRGKVVLLFFGYTLCPDICPGSFAKMRRLYQGLGGRSREVTVAFVSVDPERDTPEKLASYVPAFHPSFHGLRPEGEDLERIMAAYDVRVERRFPRGKGAGTSYSVDHTSSFFVIDRAGMLRLKIAFDAPVAEMIADVEKLLGDESPSRLAGPAGKRK